MPPGRYNGKEYRLGWAAGVFHKGRPQGPAADPASPRLSLSARPPTPWTRLRTPEWAPDEATLPRLPSSKYIGHRSAFFSRATWGRGRGHSS